MSVYRKILRGIDEEIEKQRALCEEEDVVNTSGWRLYEMTMKRAKDIIRKCMDENTERETSALKIDERWKLVEYELPEDGVEVLITYRGTDGKYYVHVDEYDHECGWATGWDDDIVAWKPLPEPYCPERRDRT